MTNRTAVLLVNLGTPDAPTPEAIRRFLREFLSDRRVVNLPRALWYPILYGFVLPFRPRRLAHAYGQIWRDDGSPLLALSCKLRDAIRSCLGDGIRVELGMRYGEPSIASALRALRDTGAGKVVVLPLYPQYSGTTTASATDGVQLALRELSWEPALEIIEDYHDDAGYIEALRDSITRYRDAHGPGEKLLLSFHGIPMKYVEAGDPYLAQCRKTASLLARALGLADSEWSVCFQSRIGRARWTSPYTEEVLTDLARAGVRTVDVACPGFSVDCLETLEEIALRDRRLFEDAGGRSLRYIPALNDDPAHATALAARMSNHLRRSPA